MNLRDRLSLSFTSHLAASPAGRAHILNQVALAESSGEARIFETLQAFIDDPKLATMVRKHGEDEVRHEQLFRARLVATGVDPGPVPAHLRMLDRLDRALGGYFDRPISNAREVMDAYLVLQVIEERAMHQFGLMEQAFRADDPATANTFLEVARDEQRHLRYCQAISKRYAPNDIARTERLDALRDIEARVFQAANMANMHHALEHGFVQGPVRRAVWSMLGEWSARRAPLPYTPFAGIHDVTPVLNNIAAAA